MADLSQLSNEELIKSIMEHPAEAEPSAGTTAGAFASDLARVPGAIAGTPRFLMYDVPNYIGGQDGNNPSDPLAKAENAILPSAEGVNKALFGDHLVEHSTPLGR